MGMFFAIITRSFIHHGRNSIRNYMSKPWFMNIAMEAPPSPLAGAIVQILGSKPKKEANEESAQGPGQTPTDGSTQAKL